MRLGNTGSKLIEIEIKTCLLRLGYVKIRLHLYFSVPFFFRPLVLESAHFPHTNSPVWHVMEVSITYGRVFDPSESKDRYYRSGSLSAGLEVRNICPRGVALNQVR
jgi:hypothetical protein